MKVTALLLLNSSLVYCQQMEDLFNTAQDVLPANFAENVQKAVGPVKEALEPYKVHESTRERGVPVTTDDLGKY